MEEDIAIWLDAASAGLVILSLGLLCVAMAALGEEERLAVGGGGGDEGREADEEGAPLLGPRRAWSRRALLEPIEE